MSLIDEIYPNHTLAVCKKLLEDLKKICQITDYVLTALFLAFHVYSAMINLQRPVLLAVNCALFLVDLIHLAVQIITSCKADKNFHKKISKPFRRALRFTKMALCLFTIGFSIYEIFAYNATKTTILLTVVLIVSFMLQILLEVIRFGVDKYVRLIVLSVKLDIDRAKKSKTLNKTVKTVTSAVGVLGAIGKPFMALSGKSRAEEEVEEATQEPLDAQEEKDRKMLEELAIAYAEERAEKIAEKKAKQETN